jgi:hypothetical protein
METETSFLASGDASLRFSLPSVIGRVLRVLSVNHITALFSYQVYELSYGLIGG